MQLLNKVKTLQILYIEVVYMEIQISLSSLAGRVCKD